MIYFGFIILVGISMILLIRLQLINHQLKSIKEQLITRKKNHSRELLSLELLSSQLNAVASLINEGMYEAEQISIAADRREKVFKEMIESISHDLRTPLTAIMGNLQLMEQSEFSDGDQRRFAIIQKHANEMAILVEKFWEYSYYSAQDQHMEIRNVNLTNLTAQCIVDMIPQFEKKGRIVYFEQATPLMVYADTDYCNRILRNLLQNCIQHASNDVKIDLFEKDKFIILSIQNPIEAHSSIDIEKIFDRFYTSDKVRTKASGLGLAVVRLLSEKMGGSCYAEISDGMLSIYVKFLPSKQR